MGRGVVESAGDLVPEQRDQGWGKEALWGHTPSDRGTSHHRDRKRLGETPALSSRAF